MPIVQEIERYISNLTGEDLEQAVELIVSCSLLESDLSAPVEDREAGLQE